VVAFFENRDVLAVFPPAGFAESVSPPFLFPLNIAETLFQLSESSLIYVEDRHA